MYTPTHGHTGHDYHVPTGTDPSASRVTNPGTQFYDTHRAPGGPIVLEATYGESSE